MPLIAYSRCGRTMVQYSGINADIGSSENDRRPMNSFFRCIRRLSVVTMKCDYRTRAEKGNRNWIGKCKPRISPRTFLSREAFNYLLKDDVIGVS